MSDDRENAPKFTLTAGDPTAPYLLRIWASMHKGDRFGATEHFCRMVIDIGTQFMTSPNQLSAREAEQIADDMDERL